MINNKSILKRAASSLLVAFFCLYAMPTQADSVVVGNSDGRTVTYEQVGKTDTAGVALFFPQSRMQAYRGCKITQIDLQLYDKTSTDGLQIFISRSLTGPHDYSETLTADKAKMSITLQTPYEITGDSLYIGYTVEGMRYLCYTNSIATDTEWIWKRSSGWAQYTKDYTANLTATISGDALPNDVRLTYAYMPEFSRTGQSVPFTAQIINLGAATVNSLGVTYYVDGEPYSTETISDLNAASRKSESFTLSSFRMADESEHNVSFAITEVNGKADGTPADNSSREERMLFRKDFVGMPTVMEVFSTELCTNCPSAHKEIESVVGDASDVIEIGHHAGFYTDPFTVSASSEYEWFYNTASTYAPAVMMNRWYMGDNLPSVFSASSPIFTPAESTLTALLDITRQSPAYYNVEIEKDFSVDSRTLDLQLSVNELLPWTETDSLRLFVMLTEDSLYTENQRGASSGFYHRHSLRAMLTPTWGTPLGEINADGTIEFSYTIPEEWLPSQMQAIAFVANYDATRCTNCRIIGANSTAIAENTADAIATIAPSSTLSQIEITDIHGRHVLETNDIGAIDQLPRGLYIVKIGERVEKIMR